MVCRLPNSPALALLGKGKERKTVQAGSSTEKPDIDAKHVQLVNLSSQTQHADIRDLIDSNKDVIEADVALETPRARAHVAMTEE
jgi:hypothetical protein